MKYIFHFTISGVQGFVAKSRKTLDFAAGSAIISDLMSIAWENTKTEFKNCTPKPIFPCNKSNLPNRFIFEIETEAPKETLVTLGNNIKSAVQQYFSNTIGKDSSANCIGKEQLSRFPEMYFAITPFLGDTYTKADYHNSRNDLAAKKFVRPFMQLTPIESVGNLCTVCNERVIIYYSSKNGGKKDTFTLKPNYRKLSTPEKPLVENYNENLTDVVNEYFDQHEGLCAVCYAKRNYFSATIYPSTTRIALSHILQNVTFKTNNKINIEYIETIKNDHHFYIDNIPKTSPKTLTAQAEIEKAAITANLPYLKYYALVTFDVDNLGKILSGEWLLPQNTLSFGEYQKKVSEAIDKFIKSVCDTVSPEKGKIVYAGGEDFFVFLNFSTLLATMKEIRDNFKTIVADTLKAYLKENTTISFSAGIAIAHYKDDFKTVIPTARQMLALAKGNNKNSFAISCFEKVCISKWFDEMGLSNIQKIIDTVSCLSSSKVSPTFIRTFIETLNKMGFFIGDTTRELSILQADLKRLINNTNAENTTTDDKNKLNDTLAALYQFDFKNFASNLLISDFIYRQTKTE